MTGPLGSGYLTCVVTEACIMPTLKLKALVANKHMIAFAIPFI